MDEEKRVVPEGWQGQIWGRMSQPQPIERAIEVHQPCVQLGLQLATRQLYVEPAQKTINAAQSLHARLAQAASFYAIFRRDTWVIIFLHSVLKFKLFFDYLKFVILTSCHDIRLSKLFLRTMVSARFLGCNACKRRTKRS